MTLNLQKTANLNCVVSVVPISLLLGYEAFSQFFKKIIGLLLTWKNCGHFSGKKWKYDSVEKHSLTDVIYEYVFNIFFTLIYFSASN